MQEGVSAADVKKALLKASSDGDEEQVVVSVLIPLSHVVRIALVSVLIPLSHVVRIALYH